MEHCFWATEIGVEGRCGCSHPQVIHSLPGVASLTTCERCPKRSVTYVEPAVRETPAIPTSAVTATPQKPTPCKGCKGCIEKRIQFVYPYWHGGAVGDELLWSIRSVETFCQVEAEIVVVGDRPPWYKGIYIPQKRVGRHTPNRCFRDMLAKMITISTHRLIRPRFVWMMDDIYAVKPFKWQDLHIARAARWAGSTGNSWQRIKSNTMRALQQNGLTTHDYATHLCHTVCKEKLQEIIQRYDLASQTMLWEVLYGNSYRDNPISPRPFFARITSRMGADDVRVRIQNATFCNNASSAWNDGLRDVLRDLLPNPSRVETGDIQSNAITRPDRAGRNVRRRPAHIPGAYQ